MAATGLVSLLVGLAYGGSLLHAVALGFYIVGALLLLGCFIMGIRGPLRGVSRTGETVPLIGARGVRRAKPLERLEATQISILLFVLGLLLIAIGTVLDPAHKAF